MPENETLNQATENRRSFGLKIAVGSAMGVVASTLPEAHANAMTTEIADKFQSLVGQKFEIVQDGRASFSATLDEVCRYRVTNDVHRPSHLPRRQGYSLVFVPDSGETIDPSGLCRLMHPALESDHVLVVPVEGNAKLEAVFN